MVVSSFQLVVEVRNQGIMATLARRFRMSASLMSGAKTEMGGHWSRSTRKVSHWPVTGAATGGDTGPCC